jgi:hypothetical protein
MELVEGNKRVYSYNENTTKNARNFFAPKRLTTRNVPGILFTETKTYRKRGTGKVYDIASVLESRDWCNPIRKHS